jgi:hypothetical protein
VTLPARVILQFLVLTGVEPRWLLMGKGKRYRARPVGSVWHTPR